MERLKTLTTLVYLLAGLLLFELGFLVFQIRPQTLVLWVTLGAIVVVCLYLVRLALGLLKELKDKNPEE
jgi:hypothetical protein